MWGHSVPANMVTGSYSIEELAEETGFDKRVIRSFIEQGLLCGPESKGRYARYTEAHLNRLLSIRQLKSRHNMSLCEIRSAFLSMTEKDIQLLSAKALLDGKNDLLPASSVLDYLRSVQAPGSQLELPALDASGSMPRLSAVDRLLSILQEDLSVRNQAATGKGQLWYRFSVTPDIEISVRGLQDGGQVEQWDRIADCLREILLGGGKHE